MSLVDYVAIGSIIIDDIVDPQGKSNMAVLGGGGSHAVSGMRVWSENTALLAIIGDGFPQIAWQRLNRLTNTSGIINRPVPQPRFWQLFETDGTRNEIPRTDFEVFKKIPVRPDEFPSAFAQAKGVFLQTPTANEGLAWIEHLRQLNPNIVILWEPWEIFYTPENLAGFKEVAPHFDIVSPQTLELSWMLGETNPKKQVDMLIECGVKCFALRLGVEGSLVGTASVQHHIPTLSVPVVDETGAGNAYCGGFVVGYVESNNDPLTAGRYGTVSSTFALAQVGVAKLSGNDTRAVATTQLQTLV